MGNEGKYDLPTAKECYELTKDPQLKNCIKKIREAVESGKTYAYIGDNEQLHEETKEFLLSRGFDLSICSYSGICEDGSKDYFNKCIFDKNASGKIIMEK